MGPSMMLSYAGFGASGFARRELPIQFFAFIGRRAPLLERSIQPSLGTLELSAKRGRVRGARGARIKLRILERGGHRRDLCLELIDCLFYGLHVAPCPPQLTSKIARCARAFFRLVSPRAFEALALMHATQRCFLARAHRGRALAFRAHQLPLREASIEFGNMSLM